MTLQELAEDFGYPNVTEACSEEGWHFDSVCPAPCTTKGCDYYEDLEPDGEGTCPECGGRLKSVLIRMGIM